MLARAMDLRPKAYVVSNDVSRSAGFTVIRSSDICPTSMLEGHSL